MNARTLKSGVFQKAQIVWPEFVMSGAGSRIQQIQCGLSSDGLGVPRLADDPQKAILRQGAGGPALANIGFKPISGQQVVNVCLVKQCQQDIYVEKCPQLKPFVIQ